jgi:hypothetical protein
MKWRRTHCAPTPIGFVPPAACGRSPGIVVRRRDESVLNWRNENVANSSKKIFSNSEDKKSVSEASSSTCRNTNVDPFGNRILLSVMWNASRPMPMRSSSEGMKSS